MSFRTGLLFAAFYVLAAVVIALAVPLALTVERRASSDFETAVLGDAAILAARIADVVPQDASTTRPARRRAVARLVDESVGARTERVVVTDAAGRIVVDSAGLARAGVPYASSARPELQEALFRGVIDARRRFSESLGEELLLVTMPVVNEGRVVGAVRVSAGTADIAADVRASWLRLALLGVAVVAAGLVLAWLLARPLGRQIDRLGDAAARLGRGEHGARAPEEGPAELVALARSFNGMAASVTGTLESQREFVANASHQLRTPLTGIRLRLEAIAREGGSARAQAEKAEVELDRLSALVDDLLTLARTAESQPAGRAVDLSELAADAGTRWAERAAKAATRIDIAAAGEGVVWADRVDLEHVLDNLLDNALRYTPRGTSVRVETALRDGCVVLAVADAGPGIPPEDRTRIFERFYRGTNGRLAGSGTGLGLAIVDELTRRWGGSVTLAQGPGTRIEVSLPQLPILDRAVTETSLAAR
jgi:two-component system, OmpR family, sensor kinase